VRNLLRVTNPREIETLVDRVHDLWLDADSIQFSPADSIVTIRYLKDLKPSSFFGRRDRFPAEECILRISGVTSLSVQDTAKIQFYDINTVTYDSASKCVEIKTGIPINIRATVRDLDITIEETGNVVSK
jgi:hypothetical protein